MKTLTIILILFSTIFMHACAVKGPVHAYPGKQHPTSETAHLRIPGPVTVTRIDRKKVSVPSQETGFYDIYLLPGPHRIEFKYELYWGDNDSGRMVKSDVIGINAQLNSGMTYELTYTVPRNETEAFFNISEFSAVLVEKPGGRKFASHTLDELDAVGFESIVPGVLPAMEQPKSLPTAASETITPPVDANTAAHEDAVKRLKFWWLIANEKERQSFKEWMQSIEATVPVTNGK